MYLLTIVLNFILQAELARIRVNTFFSDILAILVIGFFSLVFFIIVVVVVTLSRKKRVDTHNNFASRQGWQTINEADLKFIPNSHHYSLFMNGEAKQLYGLIQKQYGSGNLFAFEYSFSVADKNKELHGFSQTVLAFQSPKLNLPYFSLYPENNLTFIGSAFGYNDVNFSSHPHFSQQYKLSTTNESYTRQLFNSKILSSLEQMPLINIDGGGNYVFIYQLNSVAPHQQFDSFINGRINYLNLFAV